MNRLLHSFSITGPAHLTFERRGFVTAGVARPASPASMASPGLPLKYRPIDAYLASAIPLLPLSFFPVAGPWADILTMFITLGKASRVPTQGYRGHVGGIPISGNRIVRSVL